MATGKNANKGKLKKRLQRMAEAKQRRLNPVQERILELCSSFQSFWKADFETQQLVVGLVIQAWNYSIVAPERWESMLRDAAEAAGATDNLDLLLRDMGETIKRKNELFPGDNRYVAAHELHRKGRDLSMNMDVFDLGETVAPELMAEMEGHLRDELAASFQARKQAVEAAATEAPEAGAETVERREPRTKLAYRPS